jgi:hypothetical protein
VGRWRARQRRWFWRARTLGVDSLGIRPHEGERDENVSHCPVERDVRSHGAGSTWQAFGTFRQVVGAGSFEGITSIGLGVRAKLPFRVLTTNGPDGHSHLVIDVAIAGSCALRRSRGGGAEVFQQSAQHHPDRSALRPHQGRYRLLVECRAAKGAPRNKALLPVLGVIFVLPPSGTGDRAGGTGARACCGTVDERLARPGRAHSSGGPGIHGIHDPGEFSGIIPENSPGSRNSQHMERSISYAEAHISPTQGSRPTHRRHLSIAIPGHPLPTGPRPRGYRRPPAPQRHPRSQPGHHRHGHDHPKIPPPHPRRPLRARHKAVAPRPDNHAGTRQVLQRSNLRVDHLWVLKDCIAPVGDPARSPALARSSPRMI